MNLRECDLFLHSLLSRPGRPTDAELGRPLAVATQLCDEVRRHRADRHGRAWRRPWECVRV